MRKGSELSSHWMFSFTRSFFTGLAFIAAPLILYAIIASSILLRSSPSFPPITFPPTIHDLSKSFIPLTLLCISLLISAIIIFSGKISSVIEISNMYLYLTGWLFISISIPCLITYWIIFPVNYKSAIQTGAFISSTGFAIIYYLSNQHQFSSLSDRVGYFLAVAMAPPTAIGFFL